MRLHVGTVDSRSAFRTIRVFSALLLPVRRKSILRVGKPVPACNKQCWEIIMTHNIDSPAAAAPLRIFMLPHLAAHDLATLRGAHSALKALVDEETQDVWEKATRSLFSVPPPTGGSVAQIHKALVTGSQAAAGLRAGRFAKRRLADAQSHTAQASPNAGQLAFITSRGQVGVCEAHGSSKQIFQTAEPLSQVEWLPNGRQLLVRSEVGKWFGVVDIQARQLTLRKDLWAQQEVYGSVASSPNGQHLAYLTPAGGVAVLKLASREERLHPPERQALRTCRLSWSPTGEHLLAAGQSLSHYKVCPGTLYSAADDFRRAQHIHSCLFPQWSPDGTWLAHYNGDSVSIFQAAQRNLRAPSIAGMLNAEWSADGRRCYLQRKNCEPDLVLDTATWLQVNEASPAKNDTTSPRGTHRVMLQTRECVEYENTTTHQLHRIPLPAASIRPAASSYQFDTYENLFNHVEYVHWAPWPMAGNIFAAVMTDQSVLLVNADKHTLTAVLSPKAAARYPKAGDDPGKCKGYKRVGVQWGMDDTTLRVGRANGVEIFDFSTT